MTGMALGLGGGESSNDWYGPRFGGGESSNDWYGPRFGGGEFK